MSLDANFPVCGVNICAVGYQIERPAVHGDGASVFFCVSWKLTPSNVIWHHSTLSWKQPGFTYIKDRLQQLSDTSYLKVLSQASTAHLWDGGKNNSTSVSASRKRRQNGTFGSGWGKGFSFNYLWTSQSALLGLLRTIMVRYELNHIRKSSAGGSRMLNGFG